MAFPVATRPAEEYNAIIYDGDGPEMRKQGTHFLKSARRATWSLWRVAEMTEEEAYERFLKHRWPRTAGQPVCRFCKCERCYTITTRRIFKCSACRRTFSVTAGTQFNSRKITFKRIIAEITTFVLNAKGISAIHASRTVGLNTKTSFIFNHKIRETIAIKRGDLVLSGEVEQDAAYYGGHVRPGNTGREGLRPDKKQPKKLPKKRAVFVMRERGGNTVTRVIESETTEEILAANAKHVAPGSVIYTDEHKAYGALHARYKTYHVNHRLEYVNGRIHTNGAEGFHSRMRRAEIGVYHRISSHLLGLYSAEMAYREDRRRVDDASQVWEVIEMMLATPVSRVWTGRWQKTAWC
ncbi:transposase-like protein [Nitrospirillum pindoramense]|uniref:Transposase-like protein n=1 Tax=Nitrospirillum amazonense TaxID=28077 RepID=A0A560GVG9_9PROT|nr:transposase-like protein [Nitrospirillum amazonense]